MNKMYFHLYWRPKGPGTPVQSYAREECTYFTSIGNGKWLYEKVTAETGGKETAHFIEFGDGLIIHRDDGECVTYTSNFMGLISPKYYVDGVEYTKEQFLRYLSREKMKNGCAELSPLYEL